jgi:hypothetical protein
MQPFSLEWFSIPEQSFICDPDELTASKVAPTSPHIEDIKILLAFIEGLKNASLDDSGLDKEVLK